jgi:hypothetical protein
VRHPFEYLQHSLYTGLAQFAMREHCEAEE